jgi:hypothetical protein
MTFGDQHLAAALNDELPALVPLGDNACGLSTRRVA